MQIRPAFFLAASLALVAAPGLACAHGKHAKQEKHEEHAAHQHGHGRFNLAIEKQSVLIELEIPANDIVGFEHEAKTDKDKAAVAAAKAKLGDPLRLFGIPKAAECKLDKSEITIETGEEALEQSQKEPPASKPSEKPAHAEFHAQYTLQCAKPTELKALDFAFFKEFPNAVELEVFVLGEKGQMKGEASRKSPKLAIKGVR